jgi:F-type H+-transporting ATPase subunit a
LAKHYAALANPLVFQHVSVSQSLSSLRIALACILFIVGWSLVGVPATATTTATTIAYDAAAETEESSSPIDVMGKIADHDYIESPFGKVYLPRIFWVEGQLYTYANTKKALESGEFIDKEGTLYRADNTPVTIDMSITSHLVYVWLGFILALLISLWAASRYRRGIGRTSAPKGALHNIYEILYLFIRDDVIQSYIPKEKAPRYTPLLFSMFMAIAFMNLFGLLPWAATATADLTVTATLAFVTFVVTQASGTKTYWGHVFNFPGVPLLVKFILTPVEILGLFTKPLALCFRLFANMLSGKIMIISILGLIFIFTDLFGATVGVGSSVIWVALTSVLYILKVFVALLQAYIFTLLSAVFIGGALEEHHHEEHDHEDLAKMDTVQA